MATPKCKGIWEITLATQQRGKMSLGKEVTPEAQGVCADAGRTPTSAAACPCFHPCAHELRSEPGSLMYALVCSESDSLTRTHVLGPIEAQKQALRGVCPCTCAHKCLHL